MIDCAAPNRNISSFATLKMAAILLLLLFMGVAHSQLSYLGSYYGSTRTRGAAVQGDFAYIAHWDSILVVDISDRTNPVLRGGIIDTVDYRAMDVEVSGNYAFVSSTAGMLTYDISNPDSLFFVSRYDLANSTYDIEIYDHYAFICRVLSSWGFHIVDISDPYNPVFLGGMYAEGANAAKVFRGIAYLAAGSGGLKIYDVSDPTAPSLLGQYLTPGQAMGVDVEMNRAFVSDYNGSLSIIDVSDPTTPSLIKTLSFSGILGDISVSNNIAYVYVDSTLYAYDMRNPNHPALMEQLSYPGTASKLIYSDNYLYALYERYGLLIFEHSYDNLSMGALEGSVMTDEYELVPNVYFEFVNVPGRYGISDAYGLYRLEDVLSGSYNIRYSRLGYRDTTVVGVNISGGQTTFRNVSIAPLYSYEATIWIGNPDGSPVAAPIGGPVDIDIYIQTADTVYIDSLYFPLGIDTSYITGMLSQEYGAYYPPLISWYDTFFESPKIGYPNHEGWHSQRFFGAYNGWPLNKSLHSDTPLKLLTFSVETINDPSLIGDTVYCLDAGNLYANMPITLRDSLGHTFAAIDIKVSPLVFGLTSDYGIISGSITDGAHNPIANAEVELLDHDRIIYSDSTGSYEFDTLIPGLYRLAVSHPLYIDTVTAYLNLTRGETKSLDIVLPYRGFARGAIVDTNGVPVDSVQVQISGLSSMTALSVGDGSFAFDYLLPGEYDINFSHPFYVDTTLASLNITRGDTSVINLTLDRYPFDIYLWYGGEFTESGWNDTVYAEAGGVAAIDIWAMSKGGSYAGELGCAVGLSKNYFNGFLPDQCTVYYPLTTWDIASFVNPISDASLYSLSFNGQANLGESNNPWLYSEIPQKILTFAAAIKDDYDLAGQVVDNIVAGGIDPSFGAHYAKDTTGTTDYMLWNYYPVVSFSMPSFAYVPGDANMYNGSWPPAIIGSDVTYLVNFFRGVSTVHACMMLGLWPSADVNGDCAVIGSDVTYLVNFFRGGPAPQYCPDYPPVWLTPTDCPIESPDSWPNCDGAMPSRRITKGQSGMN